jgi:hypothetical protein
MFIGVIIAGDVNPLTTRWLMNVGTMITETIGYISEAVAVIFSPDRGGHPDLGIQPFTGDIDRDRHSRWS